MKPEKRVDYLLKAARRAERHGDHRVADLLRRMADDILPIPAARRPAPEGTPS